MAKNLAAVVEEARLRAFVGRAAEIAEFDAALRGGPPRVLFVHGPGGIGKTTLLHRFRARARAAGRPVTAIDARGVDCSPDGVRDAFDRAVAGIGESGAGGGAERAVLLIDGYEHLGPIDGWVREEFLASVPEGMVVVLAGRTEPSAPWRADPGWRAITACGRLAALTPAESIELLRRAGVDGPRGAHLAALGQGHPLTLALLADAAAAGPLPTGLADAPDLVAALMAQVVGDVPDEDHAAGLAVCAHAWLTTEDLLRSVVGERAPEIWAWLEARPYVTRGIDGLYAHALVREVLDADLRRRSPDGYRRIRRIIHAHVCDNLRHSDGTDPRFWAHQKIYLHRRSPLMGPLPALREQGAATVVPAEPDDHQVALETIERFEGGRSAELAERWFTAQPENLVVVRSPEGIAGFAFHVVHPTDPSLCADDPVVAAALEHAARVSPARSGEQITIGRFLSGVHGHQRDPHAVLAGTVLSLIEWARKPLAWSFVAVCDPGFWIPAADYMAFDTRLAAEFAGLRYTIFGNDWRRLPLQAWLDLMGERELSGATGPPPPELLRPAPLGRERFAEAVRLALRDLHRPDRLRGNALMGSALAAGLDGASADRLVAILLAGIEQIGREPRAGTLHRVLDRTFVRGAPTQEAAAEVLGLPLSTYRRHLARALERLTDLLWAAEIGQVRLGHG